jgi:hypothetical protein
MFSDASLVQEKIENVEKTRFMPTHVLDDYHIVPGLVDFGMTVR